MPLRNRHFTSTFTAYSTSSAAGSVPSGRQAGHSGLGSPRLRGTPHDRHAPRCVLGPTRSSSGRFYGFRLVYYFTRNRISRSKTGRLGVKLCQHYNFCTLINTLRGSTLLLSISRKYSDAAVEDRGKGRECEQHNYHPCQNSISSKSKSLPPNHVSSGGAPRCSGTRPIEPLRGRFRLAHVAGSILARASVCKCTRNQSPPRRAACSLLPPPCRYRARCRPFSPVPFPQVAAPAAAVPFCRRAR